MCKISKDRDDLFSFRFGRRSDFDTFYVADSSNERD